jgi:geranylgeranylglycerol-phosphate geranylgeranyltransferase
MEKLKAFIQLTRMEHAVFLSLAVLVGQAVFLGSLPSFDAKICYALLSPFFIELGAFALNDYLDLPTDRKNKRRDRPLVRKALSMTTARLTAIITISIGISLAFSVNQTCGYIAAFFSFLSIAYAYSLKKLPVIGNAAIAASMAIPFIFGNYSVSGELTTAIWFLSLIAFCMGLGREIAGSIRDMAGDILQGRRTLPIVIGANKSRWYAALFITFAVMISPLPFFKIAQYLYNPYYWFPIAVTDALLVASIYYVLALKHLKLVRNLTLIAQLTGLLGFLLGAIM